MQTAILSIVIGTALGAVIGYFGKCASGACSLTANWRRGAVYGGLLGLGLHLAACGVGGGSYPEAINVKRVTEAGFQQEVLESELPVVVDFYATWCGPCKQQAPILDKLAGDLSGKIKFVQVDVDESPALARKYEIEGMPTLMIFRSGKVADKILGLTGEKELKTRFEKVL